MSEYTLFAKRVGLTGFTRTIVGLKGLVLLPILTKTLGPSNYGMWVLIVSTITLLEPFIEFGLGSSIVRYLPSKCKKEIIQGIITSLSVVSFFGIIAFLLACILSNTLALLIFKNETSSILIIIISLLIILKALYTISFNSFRIFGQIKRESIVLLLTTFLEIGLIGYVVSLGYGILGALISLLATTFISILITLYFIFSYSGFEYPNFSLIRPFITFGYPFIFTAIFEIAIQSSDRYIIGYFLGTKAVGIYSAAYGIGGMVVVFIPFIMRTLNPTISALYDKGLISEVKIYLSYSWKYMLMLLIPSVFGMALLSKQVIINLTTFEFATDGQLISTIIALSMSFYCIYSIYSEVIKLENKTRLFMSSTFVSILVNILLNIIFIPIYGVVSAAITTLLSYIICAVIVSQNAHIKFNKHYNFLMKCTISSIVMIFIIWRFNPKESIEILFSIISGVIIYFSTLLFLRSFDKKEIAFIQETLLSLISSNNRSQI